MANNSALKDINGFQSLQTVGGNIDITGDFNSLSLPSLTKVGGGLNIQSSSSSFVCPIANDRANGVIQGHGFVCSGNIAHPMPGVGANVSANVPLVTGMSSGVLLLSYSGLLVRNTYVD